MGNLLPMPPWKRPFVASLDQVRISREGDVAVIHYAAADIGDVRLKLGPDVCGMSDQAILEAHNEVLRAQEQLRAQYEHVAVEVPLGRPQLHRDPRIDHWLARGDVLRCIISDGGPDYETTICIDDHELSMKEFGEVLSTFNGWGMRVVIVPDDELHERPMIEVREPDEG